MTAETRTALLQEWITLQNSVDKSEGLSLVIKLSGVAVCLIGLTLNWNPVITGLLLMVIWLQESIWKTFQGRTEQRLLAIESAWQHSEESSALNFYHHWSASRPGTTQLITQYLSNAIRPTIAFPYLVLLPISFLEKFL